MTSYTRSALAALSTLAMATAVVFQPAVHAAAHAAAAAPPMSSETALLVQHVLRTGDQMQAPFIVLDKRQARLWVLDASGGLIGTTPVLLGLAIGDDSVPGIGEKPLSQVKPEERTTPAGRFGLEPGVNLNGEDILWVDYDAAVSLHRVRANNPVEQRLQRLASPGVGDNRISYGCINVPTDFYNGVIRPRFSSLPARRAAIYVLPEKRSLAEAFPFVTPMKGQGETR